MTRRSVIAVVLLGIFTFGIYTFLWLIMTKDEMNRRGADIPTAWLLVIPFINIFWLWRYAEGAARVTEYRVGASSGFALLVLCWTIGLMVIPAGILQSRYNRVGDAPVPVLPRAKVV